jgi:hypothetical protein
MVQISVCAPVPSFASGAAILAFPPSRHTGAARYIAKWQATNWSGRSSRIIGSSAAQRG